MLNERERERIRAEAAHFEQPRAAVGEALMIVQESRGWVSDEGVADIAGVLGMSTAEVDAIATYSDLVYRRPVGRHVILLCDSVSCWTTGSEDIASHIKTRLGIEPGETSADGRFTLLPVGCLGACELAPAMMMDGRLYGNLTPEGVDRILADPEKPAGESAS